MKIEKFKTYWIIDGERVTSGREMRRRVLKGENAVEVSAEMQQQAHERRERAAAHEAELGERIEHEAIRQEHEVSPEGKLEQARRTAFENPGGIVSGGVNPFVELEALMHDKTSPF